MRRHDYARGQRRAASKFARDHVGTRLFHLHMASSAHGFFICTWPHRHTTFSFARGLIGTRRLHLHAASSARGVFICTRPLARGVFICMRPHQHSASQYLHLALRRAALLSLARGIDRRRPLIIIADRRPSSCEAQATAPVRTSASSLSKE